MYVHFQFLVSPKAAKRKQNESPRTHPTSFRHVLMLQRTFLNSYSVQDFPMLKPGRTVNCCFRQNWAVFDIVYLFYLHPQGSYFDFFLFSLESFVRNYQTWTIQRINEAEIEFPTDPTVPSKVQLTKYLKASLSLINLYCLNNWIILRFGCTDDWNQY